MTKEEAIFCEKSYLGETNCTNCKYYGTNTCRSRESHRMAIKALEKQQLSEWEYDHAILKAYGEGQASVEKVGRWIDREVYDADRWECSECGRTEPYKENFCPNCGARMEGM